MIRVILLAISALIFTNLYSQNIYLSKQFQKALEKQTRTLTGVPGPNYWINKADYQISAYFDPKQAKIYNAKAIIKYHNNSPDTLTEIVFRLYQDIWKYGVPRDFQAPKEDLNDGTIIHKISVNGYQVPENKINRYSTLMIVKLKNPILPHSTAHIEIEWTAFIPTHRAIRYGKYDNDVFFIGYWYPQIAVYDDIDGWDLTPFSGIKEYYNDHNNFDVTIYLPNGYMMWATGILQNPQEIFANKILKKYQQAQNSEQTVKIISSKDKYSKIFATKANIIKWHFKAENVPDFAFGVSNKFVWDAAILNLDNKKIFISAAYNPNSEGFKNMVQLVKQILITFKNYIPGLIYPYPAMTIFNGGGAMEYPMMVNLANFKDHCANIYVTAHEVGHTFFPFMTGTNETDYAWMDEGLINFFPRFVQSKIDTTCNSIQTMVNRYLTLAGTSHDLPLMTPSADISDWLVYRHIAYNKPAFAFLMLQQYLGEQTFYQALREFANRWEFKHPTPYDFFFTFNDVTKQNLNWFWNAYFFNFNYPDLAIKKAIVYPDSILVYVENKGGLPVNFNITLKNGNKEISYSQKMDVFKKDKLAIIKLPNKFIPFEISISVPYNADLYPENNTLKADTIQLIHTQ